MIRNPKYLTTVGLSVTILMSSCSNSIGDTGIDAMSIENGEVIILDTPRMFNEFEVIIDFRISNELKRLRPPNRARSWNDYWNKFVTNTRNGNRENKEKYIDYIIESRRIRRLPELMDVSVK